MGGLENAPETVRERLENAEKQAPGPRLCSKLQIAEEEWKQLDCNKKVGPRVQIMRLTTYCREKVGQREGLDYLEA